MHLNTFIGHLLLGQVPGIGCIVTGSYKREESSTYSFLQALYCIWPSNGKQWDFFLEV